MPAGLNLVDFVFAANFAADLHLFQYLAEVHGSEAVDHPFAVTVLAEILQVGPAFHCPCYQTALCLFFGDCCALMNGG